MGNCIYSTLSGILDKVSGWSLLTSTDWVVLLKSDDRFKIKCDAIKAWKVFSSADWANLLKCKPYYGCHCDSWDGFKTSEWAEILRCQPELAEKYKKSLSLHWCRNDLCSKLYEWLSFRERSLSERKNTPRDQLPRITTLKERDDIFFLFSIIARDVDWLDILQRHHKFATRYCDKYEGWKCFNASNWVDLLAKQPVFADWCEKYAGWNCFNGNDWSELLASRPSLSKWCDKHDGWRLFKGSDWTKILIAHQPFKKKCSEYNKWRCFGGKYDGWRCLDGGDRQVLLSSKPSFIDRFNEYEGWRLLSGRQWIELLIERPQFAACCDKANGWKLIGDEQYYIGSSGRAYSLLSARPEFAYQWAHEHITGWCILLIEHPNLITYCDKWNGWTSFESKDWLVLLDNLPKCLDNCDKANGWAKIHNCDWVHLLQKYPNLEAKCDELNIWGKFNGFDWVALLREQPQFADKCDLFNGWFKIDFATQTTCNSPLKQCEVHGGIIDSKGSIAKVSKIETSYRGEVDGVPCDEEYVYFDENGLEILRTDYLPPFCGRWAELLEKQPQFVSKCDEYNGWDVFDGFDWWRLLKISSQFVRRCDALNGWKKMYDFRVAKSIGRNDCVVHEYESSRFEFPAEYGDVFSREVMLSSVDTSNGLPVVCWMCNDDAVKDECKLGTDISKTFWVYHLSQDQGLAISWPGAWGVENIWSLFTIEDWKFAIRNRTDFLNSVYEYCDFDFKDYKYEPDLDLWKDAFWDALISLWPDFFKDLGYCSKVSDNPYDDPYYVRCRAWPYLIRHRPGLIKYMYGNEWKSFDKKDWEKLLHPHWQFLDKCISQIDAWCFWRSCLTIAPQFASLCEQHGWWHKFTNAGLCELLEGNQALMDYCVRYIKWGNLGVKDWLGLMSVKNIRDKIVALCDKHGGWHCFEERTDCLGWAKLLEYNPQLVEKCDALKGWDKFNGYDWQVLLSVHPQFANRCDLCDGWVKLEEKNWMFLISRKKIFAVKYIEKCFAQKQWKPTEQEVLQIAEKYVEENRPRHHIDYEWDCYPDWREESGWNDVYGGGVEASDIIEFPD